MNNKKTLFMSLVIVLLVGLMITAGTFAYFQWTTDINQRTNVNVTIEAGGIKMIMTPEGGILEAQGLKPVADCMESYAYFDTTIQIQNTTGSLVVPSFKLKARVKPNSDANVGTLRKDTGNNINDLAHIHYTVVEIDRIGQEIISDKSDDTGARRCYEPSHIQKNGTGRAGLFVESSNDGTIATGTFADMNTTLDADGYTSAINLPSDNSKYLARQYNADPSDGDLGAFGVTFIGNVADNSGLTNTTRYFRVYVWIDEGYTYTNAGTNMKDPLNNAIIEVTWSTDSIVQQVTGSASLGQDSSDMKAGIYDSSGEVLSWDDAVNNSWIIVNNGVLTSMSSDDFDNKLVISSSITTIASNAFSDSFIHEIYFEKNSQLSLIDESAFESSRLEKIVLPASLTTIGRYAFAFSSLSEIIYEGTMAEWNQIDLQKGWNDGTDATQVICSDGIVEF